MKVGRKCRVALRCNRSQTWVVKTAISIPGPLFEEAECLAKRRGLSRSELYSRPVAEYVENQKVVGVRERLNSVYGVGADESKLDAALERAQSQSLPEEKR